MRDNLVRTKFHIGKLCKSRLQGADELGLQHIVKLASSVFAGNISANVRVEQKRVGDTVGVNTRAAEGYVNVKTDLGVNNTERNRIRSAEFVVQDFLGVEVVNSLILTGVAAVSETLADGLEGVQNALAEAAGEDTGLRGGIPCEFAGLRTELDNLALLNDDHGLAVCYGDAGTVGNDIVIALRVGRTASDLLLALGNKNVLVHGFAVEEFLPLIRKRAACRTQ